MCKNDNFITWLILAGRKKGACIPARWVEDAKEALVFDLLEKIKNIKKIDRIIISSNNPDFLEKAAVLDSRVIPDRLMVDGQFHFGEWLAGIVRRYKPKNLFYWGGGASPFIRTKTLESLSESIISGENMLYTNNFFSADWAVFTPANSALEITPPPMDNNLANYLWKERKLDSVYLEPSLEMAGDVDTPADLTVLKECPGIGSNLEECLKRLNLDTTRVKRIIELLPNRNRIFLAGRVGSAIFRYLDRNNFCSYRIISEERGMRSSGRIGKEKINSILGEMFENMGIDRTFSFIESSSDGAVIDSRVAFSHVRGKVNTNDRFYSDLGMPEMIEDPWIREFTERAVSSTIPILTGGHSLVLGGLWALVSAYGENGYFDDSGKK